MDSPASLAPPIEQSGLAGELREWIARGFEAFARSEPDFTISAGLASRAAESVVSQPWPTALTADKARDEALEEAAKVAEGEKYTKAYSDASYSAGDEKPQIYNDACDDIAQAIRSRKGAAK